MDLVFEKVHEAEPGPAWQQHFDRLWPAYRRWFLREGIGARQTYLAGVRALKAHMPELLPTYERLCELAGGGDLEARFLSFFQPPLYLSGCSQAVLTGPEPLLVRNYDYAPELSDALFWDSAWNGKRVIATSDGMWGVVDGMNETGLAVSLTFGGRRVAGQGFGVPLILRYVLEFCDTVSEAVGVLQRVPCHMAYNITLVDKAGAFKTVYLGPDREAIVTDQRVATNHQESVEWHGHALATATVERERFLLQRLTMREEPAEKFIGSFLRPPLYSTRFSRGFGTLYTAVYYPAAGRCELRWPGEVWQHSFDEPVNGKRLIRYPEHVS